MFRKALVVAMVSSVAIAATPIVARSAKFTIKTLNGGYECLGDAQFIVTGNSTEISELMQLNFDGKGHVNGTFHGVFQGVDCPGTITSGIYSVNSNGTGSLTLPVTLSGSSTCTNLNSGLDPHHLDLVLKVRGIGFDFSAPDDSSCGVKCIGQGPISDVHGSYHGSCASQTKG